MSNEIMDKKVQNLAMLTQKSYAQLKEEGLIKENTSTQYELTETGRKALIEKMHKKMMEGYKWNR